MNFSDIAESMKPGRLDDNVNAIGDLQLIEICHLYAASYPGLPPRRRVFAGQYRGNHEISREIPDGRDFEQEIEKMDGFSIVRPNHTTKNTNLKEEHYYDQFS